MGGSCWASHFGWVDHVEPVVLKVALKSIKCGQPCCSQYACRKQHLSSVKSSMQRNSHSWIGCFESVSSITAVNESLFLSVQQCCNLWEFFCVFIYSWSASWAMVYTDWNRKQRVNTDLESVVIMQIKVTVLLMSKFGGSQPVVGGPPSGPWGGSRWSPAKSPEELLFWLKLCLLSLLLLRVHQYSMQFVSKIVSHDNKISHVLGPGG